MTDKPLLTLGQDGQAMLLGSDGSEKAMPAPYRHSGQGTVYLLVDCSISMSGENIRQARRGASDFIYESVAKGYSVGLISFASEASMLVAGSRCSADFRGPIDALTANGSTNMTDALRMAFTALAGIEGARCVVVVSDGSPNDPVSAREAARQLAEAGVEIMTIATEDADTAFLASIATAGDLASVVSPEHLNDGIADAALQLPWLQDQ